MNVAAPATSPAFARARPDGKLIYYWLLLCLFLEYARPASFFAFLNIPFFYSLFPLAMFIASLFVPGLRSPKEAFADKQSRWIFALLGVVLLNTLIFWTYAVDIFTQVLGYVMVFSVIARVCTTWERVRGVAKMLIFCHVFLLAMNPQVLLDPGTRHYITGATFLGDGNDFGLSICLLFPLGIWIAQTSPSKLGKLISYATLTLLLYAIVASQSRGATLGIGALVFFLVMQSRYKVIGLVAMGVLAVGVVALAPAAYSSRMSTLANPTDGSAQGRIDAWKAGLGMGAKNPLVGVGAGSFGARWGKTAHSTYVLAFGELGIPGLICVFGIVFGNIRATVNLRKRVRSLAPPAEPPSKAKPFGVKTKVPVVDKTPEQKLAQALLFSAAAMIGFGVAGTFLSATYYPHLYVLGALMISTRLLAARDSGVALNTEKAKPKLRGFAAPAPK